MRLKLVDRPVPGQALADELGISRVALWKRIERLKSLSYRIEGSHAGYRTHCQALIDPALCSHGRVVTPRQREAVIRIAA